MRKIHNIVLHCTATSQTTKVSSIVKFWKEVNGWSAPGYHFIIKPDGTYENLQPIEKPSNGVAGQNAHSVHISYIGGVDKLNRPVDNRTGAQKQTQIDLIKRLKVQFPDAKILGHRDFPGVAKACPSFDVAEWLKCVGL